MPEDFNSSVANGWNAFNEDGQGKAALLLVESLIHGLIEHGSLTGEQAIEIVEAAAEVEDEIGLISGNASALVLAPIAASLRLDLGGTA